MTKAETQRAEHYHAMAEGLRALERDLRGTIAQSGHIPPEWHAIAQAPKRGPKQLVSFYVDAEVLAFFRSMGRGYTTRMAEVLRVFMHARLADVVQGAEAVAYSPEVTQQASRALERMQARMKRDLER